MQVTLTLVVGRRPGLLAQVVSMLMREDCKLVRQAVSPADDPAQQRFTITVEGPDAAIHDLPLLLRAFGSVEVAADGAGPAAAIAAAAAAPRTPPPPASRTPPPRTAPAGVDAAVQDIIEAFPDVAARVLALARVLPEPARAATLLALGERLGRREYQRGYALGTPLKLDAALRRMVLPAVRQLVKADLEGQALRLPACTFCAAPPGAGRGCDFLVGFTRGLLHAAPATAGALVREARCRATGDPFCELVFTAP